MENSPKHVAIIMDGNRRWAVKNNLPPLKGHQRGAEIVEKLIEHVFNNHKEIEMLTLWGFSTENWTRSKDEVDFLFQLIERFMDKLNKRVKDEERKTGFKWLGRRDRVPETLKQKLEDGERDNHEGPPYLGIALDYGGRDEIIRATKKMVAEGVSEDELTEEKFSSYLDTAGLPDPDLIIRTSGAKRLSGLFPWQGVYAEIHFEERPFPEFTPEVFDGIIEEFKTRNRTFGGTNKGMEYTKTNSK